MTFEDWWEKNCLTCAGMNKDAHEQMWECAQQVEREACAKACDVLSDECKPISIAGAYMRQAYDYSAEVIRARGNK